MKKRKKIPSDINMFDKNGKNICVTSVLLDWPGGKRPTDEEIQAMKERDIVNGILDVNGRFSDDEAES